VINHAVRAAMFSPDARDGVIAIWTINKAGWANPYRFTTFEDKYFSFENLRSGVVHQNNGYIYAVANDVRRPNDDPGQQVGLPLVLENTVQDLGFIAKESVKGINFTLKHISIADQEIIIEEFPTFRVLSAVADFDTATVALQLSMDTIENEPANNIKFTPDMFGGLFP
jgi:hypothetical protein